MADEKNISVLSLIGKKFYRGPSIPLDENRFFLLGLDLDSAWKIFSGRAPIMLHYRAVSLRPGEITLYNKQGEVVEILYFFSRSLLPGSVYFPKKGITIIFSEFKRCALGLHPLNMKIVKGDEDQLLEVRYKSLQVNKPIPEEIFRLDLPPDFEIIELDYREINLLPDF